MDRQKLIHQLFIGKVADVLGMEKTTELLKEAKEAFAIPVVGCSLKNKTPILKWKHLSSVSLRLKNALLKIDKKNEKLKQNIKYIEDLTVYDLVREINVGKVTWKEFKKMRGF